MWLWYLPGKYLSSRIGAIDGKKVKRSLALLLILTFGIQTVVPGAEGIQSSLIKPDEVLNVEIEDVVSKPGEYNGKKVTLEGIVKKVKYTTSRKGEPFTIFRLKDSDGNEVGVYYEDEHLPIKKGDKVRITGKFRKEKRYFLYKIKNVIKARTVELVQISS